MRVYRERDSLGNAQRVAHLSLRGVLKELAEPQPQKLERIKIKPPEYIETLRNNRKRAPADAAGDTTVETVTFKTAGVSGRASEAPEPQTEPVGALEDESGSAIDPEESRILPIRKWWHLQGAVRSLATTDLDPEKLAQAWFEDVEGNEEDRYLICEQVYKANETLNLIAAAMEVLEKNSKSGEE